MKGLLKLAGAWIFFLSPMAMQAGTQDQATVVEPPTSKTIEPWIITVDGPGWLASVSGHTGFHGVNPYVDVGFGSIIRHVDAIYATEAEIRKGRFGVFGDLAYLGGQGGANGSGLVSRVGAGLQSFTGEAFLAYRIIDNPRGWLDLLGGFRFTYIGMQTTLSPNVPAIDAASAELVDQFASAIKSPNVGAFIQQDISSRLGSLQRGISALPVPPIAEGQSGNIRNALNQLLLSQEPQVTAAVRSGIEARINALKTALTNQIATLVTKPLNRTYSFYDSWADPVIGLRGRLNLNKVFYLTGETDVGGFGIGSDIAFQAYGGLGCELTRNIFSEVGYRFLYDDFRDESVGYLYQLSTRGVQLKVGLRF
jgi:hypothetical protein